MKKQLDRALLLRYYYNYGMPKGFPKHWFWSSTQEAEEAPLLRV